MRKSILASLVLLPSLALASGYSLPNVNPRDLAMSASAVAAQVDSGATFANPAALARLSGPSARIGLSILNIWETWKDPTGAFPDSKIKQQYTPLPTASLSYSGKIPQLGNRGWGVGAAFDVFGGAEVQWPDNWPGRYRIVNVDRKVFDGIFSVGVEVLPMFRIGGGLLYYYTSETFDQNFPVGSFFPGAPDGKAKLDLSGHAFSYDVSAEVDPLPSIPLRIAIDYKHKATQTLKGDVKWTGIPAPIAALNPILHNQDAEQKLTVPNVLNVAAAYQVIKPLLVTFTWTLDRWVVYDEDRFVGTAPGAQLVVPRKYRNGYTLRAGAEYDVTKQLQVRAGAQRDVSGLRTDTYSPTLPDASSWAGSLGASYRFPHALSLDAGIFYAWMDRVKATNTGLDPPSSPTGLPTKTFRGTYDISALIYGLSLGWTPGRM